MRFLRVESTRRSDSSMSAVLPIPRWPDTSTVAALRSCRIRVNLAISVSRPTKPPLPGFNGSRNPGRNFSFNRSATRIPASLFTRHKSTFHLRHSSLSTFRAHSPTPCSDIKSTVEVEASKRIASTRVPISEITKLSIVDELALSPISWPGRLEETDFLARLYNLESLPSYDTRFSTASGDIWQHRVNNLDWEDDWVFYDDRFGLNHGPDETFLRFLAETLHPVLRRPEEETAQLTAIYNSHLRHDGYELAPVSTISGRPVFAAQSLLAVPSAIRDIERASSEATTEYMTTQINRMEGAISTDPDLAIGTAKELIETVCKTILRGFALEPDKNWNLQRLVKETAKCLKVTPDDVPDDSPVADTTRQVLGNLAGIVHGLAELRNHYGTGHGRPPDSRPLQPRHARLAVGAASTLAVFFFDTYDRRQPAPPVP